MDLKKEISEILHKALAGYLDDYKYKNDQGTFVRWGRVERDMHLAIDRHLLTKQPVASDEICKKKGYHSFYTTEDGFVCEHCGLRKSRR